MKLDPVTYLEVYKAGAKDAPIAGPGTWCFRFTFDSAHEHAFPIEAPSAPIRLAGGFDAALIPRDATTLDQATRFHIEGRAIPSAEEARAIGGTIRPTLNALDAIYAVGLHIPEADEVPPSPEEVAADPEKYREGVQATITGLHVFRDEEPLVDMAGSGHFRLEHENKRLLLDAFEALSSVRPSFDEVTKTALELLAAAAKDQSPRSRFMLCYLALESLVQPAKRPEPARALISELQSRVRAARQLGKAEQDALISELGRLERESVRTAIRQLLARTQGLPQFEGKSADDFFRSAAGVRNKLSHGKAHVPLDQLESDARGLRWLTVSLVWSLSGLSPVTLPGGGNPRLVNVRPVEFRFV